MPSGRGVIGLVVLLVVLAGCGAPADGGGMTPTSTATTQGTSAPATGTTPTTSQTATQQPTTPTQAEGSYLAFQNEGDTTWVLTLYLIDGRGEQFAVTYPNGTTRVVRQTDIPGIADDIEPADPVLTERTYTIEPDSNLFVWLEGCRDDTAVWFKYTQQSHRNFGYGPAYPCRDYRLLEFRGENVGGTDIGGDYTALLEAPNTTVDTVSAGS